MCNNLAVKLDADALKVALGVFVLGGAGSLLRYGLSQSLSEAWPDQGKWIALHAVNLVGALAIGVVDARVSDPALRQMWMAGLLGGLTTFSALCLALSDELAQGRHPQLVAHATAQVVVGLVAVTAARSLLGTAS